jgi:class 3 adenylate cyclase
MTLAASPTLALSWVLANPQYNVRLDSPTEHLVITANVSIVALAVAVLVARAALQLHQYRSVLLATGFACMAGLFAVHALSTPGVLQRGEREDDAALVLGVSAQLSLFVAALFFAVRYTRLVPRLERRLPPAGLIWLAALGLAMYGLVGLGYPEALRSLARLVLVPSGYESTPSPYEPGSGPSEAGPLAYLSVAGTVALYAFAAWRQGRDFLASHYPMQGALAASYVLLAQAQIAQVFGPMYTLAWWEYHGLMLGAVVIALGSLFVELDRRRGLERFLPSPVVDRVISGETVRLEGERATVTILFADMRDSTALAERFDPETTVGIVNTYLRAIARSVMSNGGVIEKFTGDGLMAIFGVPARETHAAEAAKAALEIRRALGALNERRLGRGEPTVRFGVGLHTGVVVLGAIGLPERSDYTAIGDTTNTASRMESLTKEFGVDVVLSAATAAELRDGFALRTLGEARVKGKEHPVKIFTLA